MGRGSRKLELGRVRLRRGGGGGKRGGEVRRFAKVVASGLREEVLESCHCCVCEA